MSTRTTVYVPRDVAALAVGADSVAARIAEEALVRGLNVDVVRNGSRGLLWLETLVEVKTKNGRIAYGPVLPETVASLFDAHWLNAGPHPLRLGPTEEIPYLKRQQRLTFSRMGVTDPLSIADYEAHDGFQGLRNALAMPSDDIVQVVTDSGLRGRGGPRFRLALSGRLWLERAPTKSTSFAMPMRVTPGHSLTE